MGCGEVNRDERQVMISALSRLMWCRCVVVETNDELRSSDGGVEVEAGRGGDGEREERWR